MGSIQIGNDILLAAIAVAVAIGLILLYKLAKLSDKLSDKKDYSMAAHPGYSATDSDEELIAVIAAAIAAVMETSPDNLKITSIKRTQDKAPAWSSAGKVPVLRSR